MFINSDSAAKLMYPNIIKEVTIICVHLNSIGKLQEVIKVVVA